MKKTYLIFYATNNDFRNVKTEEWRPLMWTHAECPLYAAELAKEQCEDKEITLFIREIKANGKPAEEKYYYNFIDCLPEGAHVQLQ